MSDAPTSNVKAIKEYFGTPSHPVTVAELKDLTPEERVELGEGAKIELAKVAR